MTKHQNLIVRVCKSGRPPYRKLRRAAAIRSAMHPEHLSPDDVLFWLIDSLESAKGARPWKLHDILLATHPSQVWKYGLDLRGCEDAHFGVAIAVVCSRIRLTEVRHFEGYVAGRRWRK